MEKGSIEICEVDDSFRQGYIFNTIRTIKCIRFNFTVQVSMKLTFQEEAITLHDAIVDAFTVIAEELRLYKALDWLDGKLKKLSK